MRCSSASCETQVMAWPLPRCSTSGPDAIVSDRTPQTTAFLCVAGLPGRHSNNRGPSYGMAGSDAAGLETGSLADW